MGCRSNHLRFVAALEWLDQVLLAIPSLTRSRRRHLLDTLQEIGIPVLQIPSIEEIISGRARIDSLRGFN